MINVDDTAKIEPQEVPFFKYFLKLICSRFSFSAIIPKSLRLLNDRKKLFVKFFLAIGFYDNINSACLQYLN